jgi:hypothetical protein
MIQNNLINLQKQDFNKPVYHFMKYEYLLSMIDNKELVLPKISKWDDTYENFFWKSQFQMKSENVTASNNIFQSFFGQCWTTDKDSAALWYAYSPDKKSVRIETTVQKLINVVHANTNDECLTSLGMIEYMEKEDLKNWLKQQSPISSLQTFKDIAKESLFKKRDVFSYENEFRIIYDGDYSCRDFKTFKIDVDDFITKIVLDPRTKCAENLKIISELRTKIFSDRIRKSTLYDFKHVNIKVNF